MGHRLSKTTTTTTTLSGSSSTKNATKHRKLNSSTALLSTTHQPSSPVQQQQQQHQQLSLTVAAPAAAETKLGPTINLITDTQHIRFEAATSGNGASGGISSSPQQIIIKIQLAKMESGESNSLVVEVEEEQQQQEDDQEPSQYCCPVHSNNNNNLNVERSILNLEFTHNISCDGSGGCVTLSTDSGEEFKLNNLNVSCQGGAECSVSSSSSHNYNNTIERSAGSPPKNCTRNMVTVPLIDEDGNGHRLEATALNGQNFNLTVQRIEENSAASTWNSCCLSSSSSSVLKEHTTHCCNDAGGSNRSSSGLEYMDVPDINERLTEAGRAECSIVETLSSQPSFASLAEEFGTKNEFSRRKTKPSSTYPSLSKCSDAIKQFLNPSKSSKKQQEKDKTMMMMMAPSTSRAAVINPVDIVADVPAVISTAHLDTDDEDHLAFWKGPVANDLDGSSHDHLALWTPAINDLIIPITATSQQIVVVQYPNAIVRFGTNAPTTLHDNSEDTSAGAAVATEFEIIGGGMAAAASTSAASISAAPMIHSSSITGLDNSATSSGVGCGGPTFHSQVDYIHCLVPDLEKITKSSFYWGKMDRYEAERLLEGKPEGTFLLRDSAQEEYLFSVTFRKYGRSLHARIEQFNHKFSFDCHDPGVFTASTVTGLLEHYKDPSCVMFFEPMLTIPLHRNTTFSLQQLCRATIVSRTTYDGITELELPSRVKSYLKEYHYKQRVRVKPLDEPFYIMRT